MNKPQITFKIEPRKFLLILFWAMLSIELFIVITDIFWNHYGWIPSKSLRKFFNITREDSLGNWFSSTQALLVGAVLWFITFSCYKDNSQNKKYLSWGIIAAFFTYMGIDDATKLHEKCGTAFKTITSQIHEDSLFYFIKSFTGSYASYGWQILFGPFFIGMGLFILYFLIKELKDMNSKKLIIAAFALYACAVLFDYFEGVKLSANELSIYAELANYFGTEVYRIGHFSKTIEEFMEMLGTTFFLLCFSNYLLTNFAQWTIKIKEEEKPKN